MAATIDNLFVTKVYRARLDQPRSTDLSRACRAIASADKAGRAWCRAHGYKGYTSYASLDDLELRAPEFGELKKVIDRHVAAFCGTAGFDLQRKRLKLDNLWINVLAPGGIHTGHIHPHSVVSGTCYVEVPAGASAIQFEDPRLGFMMAAPTRLAEAERGLQPFVSFAPEPGDLMLWESWLRHEVTMNHASADRISISFNYRWG